MTITSNCCVGGGEFMCFQKVKFMLINFVNFFQTGIRQSSSLLVLDAIDMSSV